MGNAPSWTTGSSAPTSKTKVLPGVVGPPKTTPTINETKLVKLAARFDAATRDPLQTKVDVPQLRSQVGQAFAGYTPEQIADIGKRAGLGQQSIFAIQSVTGKGGGASAGDILGKGVGQVLNVANVPNQVVLGTIAEGGTGALKALRGQEQYTPVQSFARGVGGETKQQAVQTEKGLGPVGGFAANLAGSVVTDPLSVVSFGTTAAGKEAALRASELTGVAADDILKRGAKAFTKDQLQQLETAGGKRLTRAVKGAPGGVKVAGRTVVNTRRLSNNLGKRLGEKYAGSDFAAGVGNKIEAGFRNEASTIQAARAGDQSLQGVAPQLSDIFAGSRGRQALSADEALATARKAFRDNHITKSQFSAIRDMLEKDPTRALTANEAQAAVDIRRIHDEVLGAEHAAGVPTPALGQGGVKAIEARLNARGSNPIADAIRRMQDPTIQDPLLLKAQAQEQAAGSAYLEHIPVDRTPSSVNTPGTGLLGSRPEGFTQQRKILGSIRDINAKVDAGILGPEARMEPDLAKVVLHRQLESAAAINHQQTVDSLLAVKGGDGSQIFQRLKTQPTQVPRGYEHITLRDPGPGGDPAHYLVRREVAGDIQRHFQNITSDQTIEQMKNLFDQYNHFWKRYAVATPGFISRNVQSNLYAASFLPERGFRATIADYTRAAGLQRKVEQGIKDSGDAFAKLNPEEARLYQAATDHGALQGGFTAADTGKHAKAITSIKDELKGGHLGQVAKRVAGRANPLGPDFLPTSALRTVNSTFEDNARLALFLHNEKALGPKGSARLVFKYLFDYNNLTPFEQKALKRISPFMTWTRKNVPLQLETALKNPSRLSRIEQIRNGINQQAGPIQNQPVPDYLSTEGAVKFPGVLPFGMGQEGVFTPDLPYKSAGDAILPLVQTLSSLTHGEVNDKALGQLIANNTGGAAGVLAGIYGLASRTNTYTGQHYTPGARVDTILGKIDPAAINFLEQLAPGLQKAKIIAPASAGDKQNQARRVLSALLGVGLTPLNAGTRNSALYDRLAGLQKAQRTATDTGGTLPTITKVPGYQAPKRQSSTASKGGSSPSWVK